MSTTSKRTSGCFRGYSSEQKALRSKLDHLIKWTRDIKSNLMKQSCKFLQNNTDLNRQLVNQIHDDLDEYKRRFDREVGRIHDICDALTDNPTKEGNLRDEILEALRRSPTYSSLEQHMDDDNRLRIRVTARERIHPGQKRKALSTDTIKRKASQPIALQVLDTSRISGEKRRSQIDAFKRSRSFTNVEHTETQLGMDYVEEDQSDLSWKPFGPKRPPTNLPAAKEKPKPSSIVRENSSDEEFDVEWERRAKQKARKEAASAPPPPPPSTPPVESPRKRTVRFSTSTIDPNDLIELDFDEAAQDGMPRPKDQNNNSDKQQTDVVQLDDDDDTIISIQQQEDCKQVIDDSDDEIIALSDDEIPKTSSIITRKRPAWTTSSIQITNENSQSQSLHNPYRVGIADPSLRSVFLPPPSNSQATSGSNSGNRRTHGGNRKPSATKRGAKNK